MGSIGPESTPSISDSPFSVAPAMTYLSIYDGIDAYLAKGMA